MSGLFERCLLFRAKNEAKALELLYTKDLEVYQKVKSSQNCNTFFDNYSKILYICYSKLAKHVSWSIY